MALELGEPSVRVDSVVEAIVILIPAMVANATPVIVKGRRPLDGGALFLDGKRLLGDGKTWEGTAAAIASGAVVSVTLSIALGAFALAYIMTLGVIGAVAGDIVASFLKRRLGIPRGQPAPILDQLDFYAGAVIAMSLAGVDWSLTAIIYSAIIVSLLHVASNYIAFRLGLKSVPW